MNINSKRLFNASSIALTVTAMTFAIRAGILSQLGAEFGLTDKELGYINQMAFLGFPIATVLGGLLYNSIGPRRILWTAFIFHIVGLVMTIFAGGFWTLLISTFFIGFANGSVEAGCNPMIANMFPKNQTTMLNKFHVWFPGGIVIGSLISKFMTDMTMGWQLQIAIMIIPALIYAYLLFGQTFPKSENLESSTAKNLKYMLTPLFLFMMLAMTLTATTELSTQQWIERILKPTNTSPMLVLTLIAGLMAVGRYFAGPVIHRLSPTRVLWISAVIATVGIYMMSEATGGMVYVAAVLFAIGVMYFWPTMLGFTSENMPKTGALGMSIIGAAGMFATSLWQPVIGGMLDVERAFAQLEGLSYEAADLAAGQATLKFIALFPAVLIIAFGILFFFKKPLMAAGDRIWG